MRRSVYKSFESSIAKKWDKTLLKLPLGIKLFKLIIVLKVHVVAQKEAFDRLDIHIPREIRNKIFEHLLEKYDDPLYRAAVAYYDKPSSLVGFYFYID
jgi:hypothetical protein